MKATRPIWLLIDVSNWAYRDLHACGPTAHAMTTFSRRVMLCREAFDAERIVFVFDSGSSFRRDLDPAYKANRRERPAGLDELMESIREMALEWAFDFAKAEGFEADDCIATLARIGREHGRNVIMASSDKDLHQCLVDGWVNQLKAIRRHEGIVEFDWMTQSRLMDLHQLRPFQWVEYQMLVGDTSDNVRGCEGFGDVAAKQLLQRRTSLDRHFMAPLEAGLTPRLKNKLSQFRQCGDMERMRRLVTLRDDVPLPAGWYEVIAS